MRYVTGVALLLAAGLLFLVQPMTGRALLPGFGGAQVVWATSLVFYQAVVLVGYAVAHASRRWMGVRGAIGAAIALACLGLIALPLALPAVMTPRPGAGPADVLAALAISAGLPCLAMTVTGPSLQAAFAATDDPRATDPYAFFAVSNAGSLVALLAYPFVVEPSFGLAQQATIWSAGFGLFLAMLVVSAVALVRRLRLSTGRAERDASDMDIAPGAAAVPEDVAVAPPRIGMWVLLAAVPSALTVAVTNVITLDLAATPLLWTAPLALYLLGYVVAFAPGGGPLVRLAAWSLPIAVVLVALVATGAVRGPLWLVLAIHLAALTLIAMALHGRLAADRPHASRLTLFYLTVAVGGVVGGAAVALVAPLVFDRLTEYPVLVAIALLLAPAGTSLRVGAVARRLDSRGVRAGIAMLVSLTVLVAVGGAAHPGAIIFAVLLPLLLLVSGRIGFAIGIGAFLILGEAAAAPGIISDRSYYSVLRVVDDGAGRRGLYSGTTLQGVQRLDEPSAPVGYYRPEGPIGQVLQELQGERSSIRMGVVGLGIGGLAAYGRDADSISFYELDPLVARLATDPSVFNVLASARGDVAVGVGDGRLLLAAEQSDTFDLIVIDAFTSNAIPAHLLTREAIALDMDRLAPDGVLAIHVSNRHVELEPVVGAAARDLGVSGLRGDDPGDPVDRVEAPASHWVFLARDATILEAWQGREGWRPLVAPAGYRAWTDDHIDLLAAVRWGG